MKQPTHRRHDLTDRQWNLIENHLPGRKGSRGRQAADNRPFINAAFLDIAYRCTLARFAARLWRPEQHPPPFYPLAQQRRLDKLMLILSAEKNME